MKKLSSFVLLGVMLLMTANVAAAQNQYEEQVLAQLEIAAGAFLEAGYDALVWEADALNQGDDHLYTVTLAEGYSYALVGVCDQDCSDLDLSLFDGYDNLVVQDTEVDSAPLIQFSVTSGGDFTLDVNMYSCSEAPCYYGVALFRW